ncbi:MAG: DUF1127 domain-containing protein [Alphaproteobacteria bacterium]|nr:DUF1127 domain-containing protein [Alphaproteobacteria bacterium]
MRHNIDTIGALAASDAPAGGVLRRAVRVLLAWQQRARERRALAAMDEHMLHDLGLTRVDIMIELDKPFWRP